MIPGIALCTIALAACPQRVASLMPPPAVSSDAPFELAYRPQSPLIQRRPAKQTYNLLYSFAASGDAQEPEFGSLVVANGNLYGTTIGGGKHGYGAVFEITPSGAETVIYSFPSYGPAGTMPLGGLIYANGQLWGTTYYGGSLKGKCRLQGCGTIFNLSLTGTEAVAYSFEGYPTDGALPYAGLTEVAGTLYGTTSAGGRFGSYPGYGTAFKIATTGQYKSLYSFGSPTNDGRRPTAGLTNVNGVLYGTTPTGGGGACTGGCGAIYQMTTNGAESVVYSFPGSDQGYDPVAVLQDVGGTLFGTTNLGGQGSACNNTGGNGCGVVFKVTTSGDESLLYSFVGSQNGPDGAIPVGGVTNVNGVLYGTTSSGGYGFGTVFEIKAGKERVLHRFLGGRTDGAIPRAALTYFNGLLYGTTTIGGPGGNGTVFTVTP